MNLSVDHLRSSFPYFCGRSGLYSNKMHDFSVNIPKSCKDVYISGIFSHTVKLWTFLHSKCSPLVYDLICSDCWVPHEVNKVTNHGSYISNYKKWIKRVRTEPQNLSMKTWDFFFPVHVMKRKNEKLYFPIKTVYDLHSR